MMGTEVAATVATTKTKFTGARLIARNERVIANQGLIHAVAKEFQHRGVEREDLTQFGNLGLIRAAEKFEPGRGLRFSTYAVYWIRQAIQKGIGDTSRPIRVPLHAQWAAKWVHQHVRDTKARTGLAPSLVEAADALVAGGTLAPSRRERWLRAAEVDRVRFGVVPLEEVVRIDPGPSAIASLIAVEWREQLALALAFLPADQRRYLTLRHGLDGSPPLKVGVVAGRLGMNWYAAERLEYVAIRALRRLISDPGDS